MLGCLGPVGVLFLGERQEPEQGVHCWMHRSRISGWLSILILNELHRKVGNRFGPPFVCGVDSRLLRHKVTEHRRTVFIYCTWSSALAS